MPLFSTALRVPAPLIAVQDLSDSLDEDFGELSTVAAGLGSSAHLSEDIAVEIAPLCPACPGFEHRHAAVGCVSTRSCR